VKGARQRGTPSLLTSTAVAKSSSANAALPAENASCASPPLIVSNRQETSSACLHSLSDAAASSAVQGHSKLACQGGSWNFVQRSAET
jgi:hypothetical protein